MASMSVDFSIVIPAYNAGASLGAALKSVFTPLEHVDLSVEVIVVNDGSLMEETERIKEIVSGFPQARLVEHVTNRGMCAARNSGISASRGDFVSLLDADDVFVETWPQAIARIRAEWPEGANVVFSPCVNQSGKLTTSVPGYAGWLTAADMINEKYSGEYNPIFLGVYARENLYSDLGTGKSCGILTYLRLLKHHPFWITAHVVRRYHDSVANSVSRGWTREDKAAETFTCFNEVLNEHGALIKQTSKKRLYEIKYKMLVYKMLSGKGRELTECIAYFSPRSFPKWVITLALLILGASLTRHVLQYAKRNGVLRRYG